MSTFNFSLPFSDPYRSRERMDIISSRLQIVAYHEIILPIPRLLRWGVSKIEKPQVLQQQGIPAWDEEPALFKHFVQVKYRSPHRRLISGGCNLKAIPIKFLSQRFNPFLRVAIIQLNMDDTNPIVDLSSDSHTDLHLKIAFFHEFLNSKVCRAI